MTNLLETGCDWLLDQREAHLATTVEYRRGVDVVDVSATLGSTRYEIADDNGVTVEALSVDFIVTAAALILDGNVVTPEVGDQIRVTRGSTVFVHEVLDLGAAGHYQPSDPFHKTLRVHAKEIDTE